MTLVRPLRPDPAAPLARANPVAKLGAAAILMATLFASVDPVTPAVVLLGLMATVPLTGLSPSALVSRTWPLLLAAAAIMVLNTLFAPTTGGPALAVGPFTVEREPVVSAVGLGLRILAIAISGVLAIATTDPTELADSLQQQLRVPARWAVGVLAAVRLLPVLAVDHQTVALARRARGVGAGRNPLRAAQLATSVLFGLLVGAIRRATRLALAMESRGFGSWPCRTSARIQRMRRSDWLLLACAALLATAAVGVSAALGTWRPLFG